MHLPPSACAGGRVSYTFGGLSPGDHVFRAHDGGCGAAGRPLFVRVAAAGALVALGARVDALEMKAAAQAAALDALVGRAKVRLRDDASPEDLPSS